MTIGSHNGNTTQIAWAPMAWHLADSKGWRDDWNFGVTLKRSPQQRAFFSNPGLYLPSLGAHARMRGHLYRFISGRSDARIQADFSGQYRCPPTYRSPRWQKKN